MNILTDIVYNVDELKECTFNLNMVRAISRLAVLAYHISYLKYHSLNVQVQTIYAIHASKSVVSQQRSGRDVYQDTFE